MARVNTARYASQLQNLEGVTIQIIPLGEAGDKAPVSPMMEAYFWTRKLPDNATLRQLINRIRTSSGHVKQGDEAQGAPGHVLLVGKHNCQLQVFTAKGSPLTKKEMSVATITMGQLRKQTVSAKPTQSQKLDKYQGKVVRKDHVASAKGSMEQIKKDDPELYAAATGKTFDPAKAQTAAKASTMDAITGMLAQFSNKPRKGEKKADTLPTDPKEAVQFLLQHWHNTGGPKEVGTTVSKEGAQFVDDMYNSAYPEMMQDVGHPPTEYLLKFWEVNRYRFGIGHPVKIPPADLPVKSTMTGKVLWLGGKQKSVIKKVVSRQLPGRPEGERTEFAITVSGEEVQTRHLIKHKGDSYQINDLAIISDGILRPETSTVTPKPGPTKPKKPALEVKAKKKGKTK
ncbi:hypothetical protein SKa4_00063 [Pseudomonas phage vB_PpuM-SKa-4]